MKKILIASMMMLSLSTNPTVFAQPIPPAPEQQQSLSSMLKDVLPSVVNIAVEGEISLAPPALEPQDEQLKRKYQRRFAGVGSGVIMDAQNGYIVTNAHVLKNASSIFVTLKDSRRIKAKIIGMDPESDIAVIQITAKNLQAVHVGDSDNLEVGEFVVAIGSPFGLNQTVTSGIISGLQRSSLNIEGAQSYESFIQTDAPINPGNSGGALVDLQGRLIGVNTAILTPDGGSVGIGFAIPVNMVRGVTMQLIQYGKVKRGLMGVMVQTITPQLADAFKMPNASGAIVTQVSSNSPAAAAGVQPYDIIEKVNDVEVKTNAQVRNTIGMLRVGSSVTLQILRGDKTLTIKTQLEDPEKYAEKNAYNDPLLRGVSYIPYKEHSISQGDVVGVRVTALGDNTPAWHAGLRPGDVITQANRQAISKLNDLDKIARDSKELLLSVNRDGGVIFVVVEPLS